MNFKNILIYALVIVFILLILLIAYNNVQPAKVNLKFLGVREFEVAVWVIMVAAFGVGLSVSFIWGLIASAVHGIESLTTKRKMKVSLQLDQYYENGLVAMLKGETKKAEDMLKKIINIDSRNIKTLIALGNVKAMEGNYEQAEEYHLRALLLDENSLQALEGLYQDYINEGKLNLAKSTIEKILNNKESDKLKYKTELVKIRVAEKNWEKAIDVQHDVVKLQSRDKRKKEEEYLLALEYQFAVSLWEKEKADEAIKILSKVKSNNKKFLPAYVKLAEIYVSREDFATAFKALTEGYHENRAHILLQMIEDLYIQTDQPDDAIDFFKELSSKMPKEVLPIFTLGKLYYRFEMIDEAFSLFERVQQSISFSPTLEYYIAKTELRMHRNEAAIKRLKEVIRKTRLLDMEYGCTACDHITGNWVDRCPHCGSWNTSDLTPKNELNALEIKQIKTPAIY